MKSKVERFEITRLFELARTDEVGLLGLGGASQQGSDRWMLVANVSGPRRLQPELYAQTASLRCVVGVVRKPGIGWFVTL